MLCPRFSGVQTCPKVETFHSSPRSLREKFYPTFAAESPLVPIHDPNYLKRQYRDASNLSKRMDLHERYSLNPHGWYRWMFDQLAEPPESRILELGCGDGRFWARNAARVPPAWKLVVSDFSAGMLAEACRTLESRSVGAEPGGETAFSVIDAQAIPFPNESFDAVIANHMLFHVPDRPRALSEIRRVLRKGGRLYASTIGLAHLRELRDWATQMDVNVPVWIGNAAESFGLENGMEQLTPWFAGVVRRIYEDSLRVTEIQPVVDYVVASVSVNESAITPERLSTLARILESVMATHGALHITKSTGIFLGVKE